MNNTEEKGPIGNLLLKFQCECADALDIYYSICRMNDEAPHLFTDKMRDLLVESAILKIFSCWESFLEETFIEYMLGAGSESQIEVVRFVSPKDKIHAYKMVQNVNVYPDWSEPDKVLIYADNFFDGCGTYKVLKVSKADIKAIRKIRNAIAHTSYQARRDFENVVRGKVGYLPDEITPAKFLHSYKVDKKRNAKTFFEYYVERLNDLAGMIVNPKQDELL